MSDSEEDASAQVTTSLKRAAERDASELSEDSSASTATGKTRKKRYVALFTVQCVLTS